MKRSMELWYKFVVLPGAIVDGVVGIASEQAIKGVIEVIRKFKPTRILELGAGIGTLTYTVLDTVISDNIHRRDDYSFYTIENNEYCLDQIPANLKGFEGLYTVLPDTSVLPKELLFDFIIVDGGGDLDGDMGNMYFNDRLDQKGVILVEGTRKYQRNQIEGWYGNRKHIYIKMKAINSKLSKGKGGVEAHNKAYHLFVFEPSWMSLVTLKIHSYLMSILSRIRRRLYK